MRREAMSIKGQARSKHLDTFLQHSSAHFSLPLPDTVLYDVYPAARCPSHTLKVLSLSLSPTQPNSANASSETPMPWLTRETGYAITDPKDYLVREFLFLLPLSSTKLGMGLEDRTARSTILYSTSTQAYSIPTSEFPAHQVRARAPGG